MDSILNIASYASKASLGIRHAETIIPTALTVGSGVLFAHAEFMDSFRRAFFENTATEQYRPVTPEKDYASTLPTPQNYGTFASYLFFGEDALSTCLEDEVLLNEEKKHVTIKVREYVDTRTRMVVDDFCLDLIDSNAVSAPARPLEMYAANDMFNRIKENWFQNLFIRATLIEAWNTTTKITSVADFGTKIVKELGDLTKIRDELKLQLEYSRQILLPDLKQKEYDVRLQATKLTQLLEQRTAYEQFILQRLQGKIIPFLKELAEKVGLTGAEAKVPQTAEEVMRFFAANDISPLAERVITAAETGAAVEPEDLDKALDLFNNMNAFIARGAKALTFSSTSDTAHLRTKLFSMMFAGAIYGVNSYADSIDKVTENMAGAGTGMMGTAMVAISKILSSLFFFPNGPISPLILSPTRITTAGIVFSVALGLRVMDIYFSRPVQPLSMSGASSMLPRSKEGDQIAKNASMSQKVFAFSRRMFSTVYQMSSIGALGGLSVMLVGYFADKQWGGGEGTTHLLSYASGTAQEYLTAGNIPWFHLRNIAANIVGLVSTRGASWLELSSPFVWLSPLDIANILTYFCMFHTAFTTAQLALGVVLDITPTKTTSVTVQPKQKVWTWLARTVGLISNWQILAPVMETFRFYVLSQILNAARSGGFGNVSRLVNLNNTGFESEGKYYIPVSTAEYHAFDEHLKLLLMSMGVGPLMLRSLIMSISGKDLFKTIDLPEGEGYLSWKRLARRTKQYFQVGLTSPMSLVLTGQTLGMLGHMAIADSLNSVWQLLSFVVKKIAAPLFAWHERATKRWMDDQREAMAEQFCEDLKELIFFKYTINDWINPTIPVEHGPGQDVGIIGLGFYTHYKQQVEDAGILRPDVATKLKRVFESVLSHEQIVSVFKYQDPNGNDYPVFLSDEHVGLLEKAFESARPMLTDYYNDDLVRNPESWVSNYTRTRALVIREGGWGPLLKNTFFTRDTPLFVGAMLKNFLFMYGAYSVHPDIAHVRESLPFVGASTIQNLAAANASFGVSSSFWAAIGYADFQSAVRSPNFMQSFSLFALATAKSAGYAQIVRSLEDPDSPMEAAAMNILYVYFLELITHREFRMLVTDRLSTNIRSLFASETSDALMNPTERTADLMQRSRIEIMKQRRKPQSFAWKALKYSAIAGLLGAGALLAAQHAVYERPAASAALVGVNSTEVGAYVPFAGEWKPVDYSFRGDQVEEKKKTKTLDDLPDEDIGGLELLDPDVEEPFVVYNAQGLHASDIRKHAPGLWRYVPKFKHGIMNSTRIEKVLLEEATIYNINDIEVVVQDDSTGLHLHGFAAVQWLQANPMPLSYTAKGNNPELFMEMEAQSRHTEVIEAILRKAGVPGDSSKTPYADPFKWTEQSRTYPQNYLLNKVLLQQLVHIHGPDFINQLVDLFERSLSVFAPWEHEYSHVTSANAEMKRLIATRVLITTDFAKKWRKGMTGKEVFDQLNNLAYHKVEGLAYQERDLRLLRVVIPGSWRDGIDNLVYRFGQLLNNQGRNEANGRAFELTNYTALAIAEQITLSTEEVQAQKDNLEAVNRYVQLGDQARDVRISLYEQKIKQSSTELVLGAARQRTHSLLGALGKFGTKLADPNILALPGGAVSGAVSGGEGGAPLVAGRRTGSDIVIPRTSLQGTVFTTANSAVITNIANSGESIYYQGVMFAPNQLTTLFEPLGKRLNDIVLVRSRADEAVWVAIEPFYPEQVGHTLFLVHDSAFNNEEIFYGTVDREPLTRSKVFIIPAVYSKEWPSGIIYVYDKETLKKVYESIQGEFNPIVHDRESKSWDDVFGDCANLQVCGMTARMYAHIKTNEADREWWAGMTEGERLDYLTTKLAAAIEAHEGYLRYNQQHGDQFLRVLQDEEDTGQMRYFKDAEVSNELVVEMENNSTFTSIQNLTETNSTEGTPSTHVDSRWLQILAALGDYVVNPPPWLQGFLGSLAVGALSKLTGFLQYMGSRGRVQAKMSRKHSGSLAMVLGQCEHIQRQHRAQLRDLHSEMMYDVLLQTSVELLRKEYHQYVAIDPLALLALDETIKNEPYLLRLIRSLYPSTSNCPLEFAPASFEDPEEVPDWLSALTNPLEVYLNDRTDVLVLSTHPDMSPIPNDIAFCAEDGMQVTSANIDAYLTWTFIQEQSKLKLATMQRNALKTGILSRDVKIESISANRK